MKRIFFLSLLIFLISAYLFLFNASSASALTIVKCETSDPGSPSCNLCEAFKMISRGIRIALYIVLPGMAAFAFMLAGVFFLFAGGNEGIVKTGKDIIKVTVYGILIAFGGWIIINTIMVELVNPDAWKWWQVWYKIPECAEEGTPAMPAIAAPQANVSIGPNEAARQFFGTLDSPTALKNLNDKGIDIIDSNGRINQPCEILKVTTSCTETGGIAEQTIDDLAKIKNTCSPGGLQISGLQETGGHTTNTNHGDGFTADIANEGLLDCIITNKQKFNISRIGCGQGTAKAGCNFKDKPNHVHIEFIKI